MTKHKQLLCTTALVLVFLFVTFVVVTEVSCSSAEVKDSTASPAKAKVKNPKTGTTATAHKRRHGSGSTASTSEWSLVPFVMPGSGVPNLDLDLDTGYDRESEKTDTITKSENLAGPDSGSQDPKNSPGPAPGSTASKDSRPNIILILTDDQDIELGSMEYMPETLKAFREGGAEFRHGYVTTPMCCPSRSSILTGLYVHNHGVYTNNDNCSSTHWRATFEKKTFASYLWDSGYHTSYIGKYLNKYNGDHIPYGWDEWNGLLMNSKYYNYSVNRNGVKVRYGNEYERDYYPNSIANDSMDFLNRMAQNAEGAGAKPFLLVISFPSPHGPEDSDPQYKDLFLNTTTHHTPSYNHAPNPDKQWILQVTSEMNPTLRNFTDLLMAKRLQTLQSVDLAVSNIMSLMGRSALGQNTFTFYTSDHGYHVGQFGLVKGKSMPFEFDIRVPYFVKGPGLIPGQIMEPVLNIDLAPTFLALAGISVPADMDGISFLGLLKGARSRPDSGSRSASTRSSFLIESSGRRDTEPSKSKQPESRRNENESTSDLCASAAQALPWPCVAGQKKYCRRDSGRVRYRKCRAVDFEAGIEAELEPEMESCDCTRFKRNSETQKVWERERKEIDEEIQELKLRIEWLEQKRRTINESEASGMGQGQEDTEFVDADFDELEEEMGRSGSGRHMEHEVGGTNLDMETGTTQGSGTDAADFCDCSPRRLKQLEKEEKRRKKLVSKLRKKQRFLHRISDPGQRIQASTCGTEEKMNCFWHDSSHWRTEPKWKLDPFCFCMNSNNNSYSCIRTVNSTHNYLYCHFMTGFKMYFDLSVDPYQLQNLIGTLPAHEEDSMLAQLLGLKGCKGAAECGVNKSARSGKELEPSIWERIFGRLRKKNRKHRNGKQGRKHA